MFVTTQFPHRYSTTVELRASTEEAFEFLDDPKKLSSHMGKSSVMMAGSKMEMKLDQRQGRGIGAEIIMHGKVMGIPLFVREFVTESIRPAKKIWETKGPQKLVLLDQYKMGFNLTPNGASSKLEVFIEYSVPNSGFGLILGKALGPMYAKWCTHRMANDAAIHFGTTRS
jgi:hypothetical protein